MVSVSIVKCPSYDTVEESVKKALDLIGGIKAFVKPGDSVLLKVNLLLPARPEAAITTHPKIVEAVVSQVLSAGGAPVIGDSSGGIGLTQKAFEVSGIAKVARELGARVVNFDTAGTHRSDIPNGKVLTKIHIAKPVFDADLVISMPKLKTHALTLYTGAVKNMYGTIPGGKKSEIHAITGSSAERFAEALIDLYSIMPLNLALMDGVVGMEGIGPNHGKPIQSKVICASRDAVALDAVASSIMGYKPRDIPMLRIARDRKLGEIDLDRIHIEGNKLEEVKVNFKKPVRIYRGLMFLPSFVRNLFMESPKLPYPVKEKCTKCNICEENCPVSAIRVNDFPNFDYKKCIRCYCCYETCPDGGIKLKKSLLP